MSRGGLRLELVDPGSRPRPEDFPDHTLFQTSAWLEFIREAQRAEPVVAALMDAASVVGWFTGLVVRKFGFRILGSPFPGWTTSYMGFNLAPGISRRAAARALVPLARKLRCVHIELMDRRLTIEDAKSLGWAYRLFGGFEIDLTQPEDSVFGNMSSPCRRCIRKAEREGIIIEEARDDAFADEYYAQLEEVFAGQSLVPTYPRQRVRALVKHLLPTGHLLLLRAREPNGACIATGIFPAMNDTMYFWGGASRREFQILRPNEAIQWYAMRYWKARGIGKYDMGGGGEYKRKYGGYEITVPWLRKSRYPVLPFLRGAARYTFAFRQRLSGAWKRIRG